MPSVFCFTWCITSGLLESQRTVLSCCVFLLQYCVRSNGPAGRVKLLLADVLDTKALGISDPPCLAGKRQIPGVYLQYIPFTSGQWKANKE